jgi:hypothetical protein
LAAEPTGNGCDYHGNITIKHIMKMAVFWVGAPCSMMQVIICGRKLTDVSEVLAAFFVRAPWAIRAVYQQP